MLLPTDFIFIVALLAILTPQALTSPVGNGTTNSTSLSTSSASKGFSRSSNTLLTFSPSANSSVSRASSSIGTPRRTSTSGTVPSSPSILSSSISTPRQTSTSRTISTSSSAPITPTPNPKATPTSTTSSSGTQTITVSGGETITVVPGVVIFGGPGGGTIIVNGVAAPIAAGALEVAGQDGNKPETTPTQDNTPTSSQPKSTQSPTSSSSSSSRSSSSSSSSASSSSTASPYLIIPVSGTTAPEATSFTTTLEGTIGAVDVVLISTDPGLISWSANLTPAQVSAVATNSIVQAVVSDQPVIDNETPNPQNTRRSYREDNAHTGASVSSLLWERDGTIQHQTNATTETKIFSQPANTPIDSVTEYTYDSQAGVGATIYIMDSGANTAHPEYADAPGTKRWLFTTADQTQNDLSGHGSCVMSKAAGVTYGIAKRPNIVMVKLQFPTGVSTILVGIAAVMRDVKANGLSGKAVLNMSFGDDKLADSATIALYYQYIQAIINMDVVVVAASGNSRTVNGLTTFSDDVDSYPALFSRLSVSFAALPIIVVGAVDNNGVRAPFSQGTSILTVSAPGVDITCMSATGTGTQVISGTSFAAPAVAGLAAYFLSLDQYTSVLQKPGQVAQNMKALISGKSRTLTTNGLLVASNAVNEMDCSSGNNAKVKRQASACPVSTTLTTLTTSASSIVMTAAATSSSTAAAPASTVLPNTEFLCTAHTQSACPADTDGATRCLGLDGALCVTICPSDSTCPGSCAAQGFPFGYCSNGQFSCICTNADPTQNRG